MDCIYCQHDRPLLVQTKLSCTFLDGFPVSNGHTLVIPRRHVQSIWELTTEEYADAFNLIRQVKDVLQKKFEPQGFNIGVNCGEAAGQTVFHAHIHIVPRYTGDIPRLKPPTQRNARRTYRAFFHAARTAQSHAVDQAA